MMVTLTDTESLTLHSGNVVQVGAVTVRALEQVLYNDTSFQDKIVGAWSFFRIKRVRARYVPKYVFPPSTSDDGVLLVTALSAGKDYSNQSVLGINAPIETSVELPSSTIFHSFKGSSQSIHVADTKWYPVQSDEVNSADRRQYDLWLLYNYVTGSASLGELGIIVFDFQIEVKGLLI